MNIKLPFLILVLIYLTNYIWLNLYNYLPDCELTNVLFLFLLPILNIVFLGCFAFFLVKAVFAIKKDERKIQKKDFILYFIMSVYPFLHLFVRNIIEVSKPVSFICISLFLFLSSCVFLIVSTFIKNRYKALFASFFIMVFINFYAAFIMHINIFNASILFLIYAALVCNTEYSVKFFRAFSFVLIAFLVLDFCKTTYVEADIPPIKTIITAFKANFNTTFVSHKKQPDVYIILTDMYAGADTLKNDYNFNNSDYYNNLKKLGFNVFDSVYSNYNKTHVTLGSVFNSDYIQNINFKEFKYAFPYSELFKKACQNGYDVSVITNVGEFSKSPYINSLSVYDNIEKLDNIKLFLSNTIFFRIEEIFNIHKSGHPIELVLNETIEKSKAPGTKAKFIFAHVLAPHYPYLIPNSNLQINDIEIADKAFNSNKEAYIAYLKYTNKLVLNTVKNIIKNSKTPPVILIFGDHGPRLSWYDKTDDSIYFNQLTAKKDFLNAQFNTFFAIYCPKDEAVKYKNINSLINYFIEFSNARFNENKPRKNDEFYYIHLIFSLNYKNDLKNITQVYLKNKNITTLKAN